MRYMPLEIFVALKSHKFTTFYELADHAAWLEGNATGNKDLAVYRVEESELSRSVNHTRSTQGGRFRSQDREFKRFKTDKRREFNRNQKSNNTRCYNCGAEGHFARGCAKPKSIRFVGADKSQGHEVDTVDNGFENTLNFREMTAAKMLGALKEAGMAGIKVKESKEEGKKEETIILNLDFNSSKPFLKISGPNGQCTWGIVDTGAMKSCIAYNDLATLGLTRADTTIRVKGVTGVSRAFHVNSARVTINGVDVELNANTIGDSSVPTLIGQPELRQLGSKGYVLNLHDMSITHMKDGTSAVTENDLHVMPLRTLEVDNVVDNSGGSVPDLVCLDEINQVDLFGIWPIEMSVWHIDEYCMINEKMNEIEHDFACNNETLTCLESNPHDKSVMESSVESDGEIIDEDNLRTHSNKSDNAAGEAFKILSEKISQTVKRDTVSGVSVEEKDKILEDKLKHLDGETKDIVKGLFEKYNDVWREPQTGRMESKAHFTVTGRPIVMKQRPMTESMVVEFKKQVDELLSKGVIQPSKSNYGAVPVFIKKPDGTWRMCFDYRRLNKFMVFDAYPIPRVWDLVKSLVEYKYYTILDANWGFWNLKLSDESKPYTAFITPWGLFEWTVLPFGIKNSPGEFQRAMDFALREIKDYINVYIDDMFFGSSGMKQHLKQLEGLLLACRKGGVYIKIAKADLIKEEIKVLGHLVNGKGCRPDPKKVKIIKALKAPTNVKEVRAFVGAVQFLARYFIMSDMLAPLTDLTKKYSRFVWTEEHQRCFDGIQQLLTENMLLTKYDESLPVGLVCDASDIGIGSCLFQVEDDKIRPIEFYSRKLTAAEKKYHIREKEFLAIKSALTHFNDVCKATHTYVFTDHKSL